MLWISPITLSQEEDELPLSFVQREGLNSRARSTLEESQNLRLLRTSVTGLRKGTLNDRTYCDNIHMVMELAQRNWSAMQSLEPLEFNLEVGHCFEGLYQGCVVMLEDPERGLELTTSAFERLDELELLVLEALQAECA